jgi:hypothetical protein
LAPSKWLEPVCYTRDRPFFGSVNGEEIDDVLVWMRRPEFCGGARTYQSLKLPTVGLIEDRFVEGVEPIATSIDLYESVAGIRWIT